MKEKIKKYPYKFLDAYSRADKDFFFGREEEVEQLYRMVFEGHILLIYGQSGTGKTSLIQCGLASKFQAHDWLALHVRRGKNLNYSLDKVLSDYAEDETFQFTESPKPGYKIDELSAKIEGVYLNAFRPVYLIFDQFEELYTLGSKEEEEHFIEAIGQILQSAQPVKLIFCIREEYLGELADFENKIPALMQKRLRIELMGPQKVRNVLLQHKTGEPEKVVNSLVEIKAGEEEAFADRVYQIVKGKSKSAGLQLPYLQVFLDKLYLLNTKDEDRRKECTFSLADLNDPKVKTIENVLQDFLETQVREVSKSLLKAYPVLGDTQVLWSILSPFVSLQMTKEPYDEKRLLVRLSSLDKGLVKAVIQAFIDRRILKYKEDIDMYELAHDALCQRIAEERDVEELNLLKGAGLVRSLTQMGDKSEVLSRNQLQLVETLLEKLKERGLIDRGGEELVERSKAEDVRRQIEKETQERQKLEKAIEDAEKERQTAEEEARLRGEAELNSKRANWNFRWAAGFAVVAMGLAIWAYQSSLQAKSNEKKANSALEIADSTLLELKRQEFDKLIEDAKTYQRSGHDTMASNALKVAFQITKEYEFADSLVLRAKITKLK